MIDALLIDVIKSGTFALISSKILKAIGEKEISEIMSGLGWTIVGTDVALILIPVVNGIQNFFDKTKNMFDSISNTVDKVTKLPVLGEFIKRGLIETTGN